MRLICIEKLAEVKGGLPARSMEEHNIGEFNNNGESSIPIEYNVEGYLLYEIEVGKNVFVDRIKRNGEEVRGLLTTSRVTEVGDKYFKTQNSVYSYKFL